MDMVTVPVIAAFACFDLKTLDVKGPRPGSAVALATCCKPSEANNSAVGLDFGRVFIAPLVWQPINHLHSETCTVCTEAGEADSQSTPCT